MKKPDKISFALPFAGFTIKDRCKLLELVSNTDMTPAQARKLLDDWNSLYPQIKTILQQRAEFHREQRCKNCNQPVQLLPEGRMGDLFKCGRCGYNNYIGQGAL